MIRNGSNVTNTEMKEREKEEMNLRSLSYMRKYLPACKRLAQVPNQFQ